MRPAKLRTPPRAARGYVLFIVVIVGLAASLAALALVSASGGARINAMHSDDGTIAQAIAEAGMNHAVAYVEAVSSTSADLDGLLDVGLDDNCSAVISGANPDNGVNLIPAITGADVVQAVSLGNRYFTRVSFNGGAYLIRFDDDEDDAIRTRRWAEITGNNETLLTGPNLECYEGARGKDSNTGNHAGGAENRLRDRNRTVWITVVGVYPGTDPDAATHRSVMRSLFTAPKPPHLAGIQVRGDFIAKGSSEFLACSAVGSVDIDGNADATGSTVACASGHSNSDEWKGNWSHCAEGSLPCENIKTPWGPITAVGGRLDEPGPKLPDMPDVKDEADEFIDFSRPCVFWVDNGTSSNLKNTLWVWDAHRQLPDGRTCSDFEGSGGAMPGEPRPADVSSSSSWQGCWTPLLLDADGANSAVIPPNQLVSSVTSVPVAVTDTIDDFGNAGSDGYLDDGGCFTVPWFDPTATVLDSIFYEKSLVPSSTCAWHPKSRPGVYVTCDDNIAGTGYAGTFECGARGRIVSGYAAPLPTPTAKELNYGSLNAKLKSMGLTTFPDGTRLNKPNWQEECKISYPTPWFDPGTPPTDYACTTCTKNNGSVVSEDYEALTYTGSSVDMLWPSPNENGDLTALPAGVYYYPKTVNLSGGPSNWTTGVTPPWSSGDPNPLVSLAKYPLITIVSDEDLKLQQQGYFMGIGQVSPTGTITSCADVPNSTDYLRQRSCVHEAETENQPRWARWATWITSKKLELQGSADNTYAGSIYTGDGVYYNGSTEFFVYGELYTDSKVEVGGGSSFNWLYQVPLGNLGERSFGGAMPTTYKSAH